MKLDILRRWLRCSCIRSRASGKRSCIAGGAHRMIPTERIIYGRFRVLGLLVWEEGRYKYVLGQKNPGTPSIEAQYI